MDVSDRDLIVKMAEGLWDEVVNANSCLLLLLYYREALCTGFTDEYNCSTAFHTIVQRALNDAMFMNLAKLYDVPSKRGRDAISVRYLIQKCRDCVNVFPDSRPGSLYSGWPFRVYFDDYRYLQAAFPDKQFASVSFISEWPCRINLIPSEILGVFEARLCRYKPAISNLMQCRNKVYAHNDGSLCFDTSQFFKENNILWSDITELLGLAYEVCSFVLGALTGVAKPRSYTNIDDIRNLFRVLRFGRRYVLDEQLSLLGRGFLSGSIKDNILKEQSKLSNVSDDFLAEIKVPKYSEGTYTDSLIHARSDDM